MKNPVEAYEVRVTLGGAGNVSFNVLFAGKPGKLDIIAAIEHKRETARVFKIASADSFIDVVKRLKVPESNHACFDTDGACIHVISVELFAVGHKRPEQPRSKAPVEMESCPLCYKRPVYKVHGKAHGEMLFHDCPGVPGSPLIWFESESEWRARNAKLRERYK